ncbi:choice-of-anchor tandem repeat GloVer-containing protein [Methylocystis heyeri]|uniref:Uncharacterized protein n=1 Tax=Methylocystis heyeri TaxID=391905 RepID=A0A6B8K9G2_9HYPH|nr:choice-of-anchor tandem repeat GloVer-containing protein [Methylocystis heyeri]QGM44924.1 hypothetical protein H2LOC_004045 [Methylocystis heyeri]
MNIRSAFRLPSHPSLAALLIAGATVPALAQTWPPAPLSEATIYSFAGSADGARPEFVTLLPDSKGALYGTTTFGGDGGGTVFKLTPPALGQSRWTKTTLYSFSITVPDAGYNPNSGLARDAGGALYGMTEMGGAKGIGVAFKLAPPVPPSTQWSYTKIHDFDQSTGSTPYGAPIFDGAGALIGSTVSGGAGGGGTIYKLTPPSSPGSQWTAATLYNFTGGADGGSPASTLMVDTGGAIYGTASGGGSGGNGVAFKLTAAGSNCTPISPSLWCETVLHAFNGNDGSHPDSGLVLDNASGVLYGTTPDGGANGKGAVYSLTPPISLSIQWVEETLYSFSGGQDGVNPHSPLALMGGSLYGATLYGGGTGCGSGCGVLFELVPPVAPALSWSENILYRFTGGSDGSWPEGGLIFNARGFGSGSAIYGVANYGGSGFGAVFTLQCARSAREVFGGAQHGACAQ